MKLLKTTPSPVTFSRLIIVMVLLLLPALIIAQVPAGVYPNKTDENGKKQGAWKKLDDQGTCIYVGQFKDDIPYGLFTYFDTDGRKMTDMNFVGYDGLIAYSKMFFVNGKMQAEGKYVNRQKDSLWKFFSEESGLLLSEENYNKGKKEGRSVVYHPGTKQPASVTTFKNNLAEGAYTEFYADGAKKMEATYISGNLEGKATWYYPDGRINILGNYQHAVKHGNWIFYNADGTVKGKESWELGKRKSQEQLVKPEDLYKGIEEPPGINGKEPGGGGN